MYMYQNVLFKNDREEIKQEYTCKLISVPAVKLNFISAKTKVKSAMH